jgi:hypothetical protein
MERHYRHQSESTDDASRSYVPARLGDLLELGTVISGMVGCFGVYVSRGYFGHYFFD